ncbi:helix-turn-helix transcriptional regulator [Xanthobacter sp. KR7-225]|uniref:helix-turn-helix domain-containing protein n=1 Tax=Xanthobacter sp. KR7-225 TaxID=3156613 RepID=UPI0032B4070A
MKPELGPVVAERLRIAARRAGGIDALAELTGTPRRTLGNYLAGRNEPKLSFMVAVSGLTGLSIDWLSGKDAEAPTGTAGPSEIDDELMGRITDAIARLYKDERVSLPAIDLGRLVARKYAEIVAATSVSDERLAMVKLIVTQLRADLRVTAAAPGSGKASA